MKRAFAFTFRERILSLIYTSLVQTASYGCHLLLRPTKRNGLLAWTTSHETPM